MDAYQRYRARRTRTQNVAVPLEEERAAEIRKWQKLTHKLEKRGWIESDYDGGYEIVRVYRTETYFSESEEEWCARVAKLEEALAKGYTIRWDERGDPWIYSRNFQTWSRL